MRIFYMMLAALLFASSAYADRKISGTITDSEFGDPIIGAIVTVKGTTIGAATDMDGKFSLNVEPGIYDVQVQYASYKTELLAGLDVRKEDVTNLAVKMVTDAQQMEELVVKAKANRQSETALLMERREATEVVQKIGAEELGRKGISNAAEGLNKVVGVSSSSGGSGGPNTQTMVRGLGDRYNQVTLNGLPIPSTDPNLKVLPLDIFPTGVIKNLAVSKSYAPSQYGDVAGGYIDVTTRDYSEEGFVRVGVSYRANTNTVGNDFLISSSAMSSRAGFDRERRALPAEVANTKVYDSDRQGATSSPFNTPFSAVRKNQTGNVGIGISTGDYFKFKKPGRGLGYFAAVNHRNTSRYNEGVLALYNAQKSARYRFETENYEYAANTTALANLSYNFNNRNTVALTAFYVNDANDTWIIGRGEDVDLGSLYTRRNNYIQNTLVTAQLTGKHDVSDKGKINWGASGNITKGSMPNRLQNTFNANEQPDGTTQYTFVSDALTDNQRFFSELDDQDFSGKLEYVRRDEEKEKGLIEIKVGANARYKQREFRSRSIDMSIGSNDPVNLDSLDNEFTNDKLGDGQNGTYKYVESYFAPNDYDAELMILAGYANAEFKLGKFRIMPGVRVEYSNQIIYYKKGSDLFAADFRDTGVLATNVMPVLTVKNEVTENSNIIFVASRTITRPQFVEVGPFRYNVAAGTQEVEGNPLLTNSTNYNVDLKYEWYPSNSELFSVNVLGKYIDKPIELAVAASVEPLLTYVNTDRAYLYGIEFEYLRNLGKWFDSKSEFMNNSTIGANASYLYSRIEIDNTADLVATQPITVTNLTRPLMGASPYIVNFDYSYRHYWNKEKTTNSQLTLTYNVFGKRVFAAGSQGAGDIYELPVNRLDLTLLNEFKNGLFANIVVRNLLNPEIKRVQNFNDGSQLEVQNFQRGLDLRVTLGYNLKY